MHILRAQHLGFCFGVRDAVALARNTARRGPVTVLGQLAHHPQVTADLRRRGAQHADEPDAVRTPTVLLTAHGVSDKRRKEIQDRGLEIVDATCPLVRRAHLALVTLVREGFHPVVVGVRNHVEVRGLTEDLPECDVILEPSDVESMAPRARFGVIAQTTQPPARVRQLTQLLRARFGSAEVRSVDTVCEPTKRRQSAAAELAARCDVVVVIGGANSNNTRELIAVCASHCPRVHRIDEAAELQQEWFSADDTVGVTAGASTPDESIEAVARQLEHWAAFDAAPSPGSVTEFPSELAAPSPLRAC